MSKDGENEKSTKLPLADLASHEGLNTPELSLQYRLLLDGINRVFQIFRDGHMQIQSSHIISFQAFAEVTEGLEIGEPETQLILNGVMALDFLAAIHRSAPGQSQKALIMLVFDNLARALEALHIDTGNITITGRGDIVRAKVDDLLKL